MYQVLLRIVGAAVLLAGVASAQELATLNVTVSDPSGRMIQGATITAKNASTGVARAQHTNRTGLAVVTALAAGDYQLRVQADGFAAWERLLTLTVGQNASVPVQLGVAAVKQSVSVSETSEVGGGIRKRASRASICSTIATCKVSIRCMERRIFRGQCQSSLAMGLGARRIQPSRLQTLRVRRGNCRRRCG